MTDLRAAAQQALEALLTYEQYIQPLTTYFGGPRVPEEGSASAKVDAAITALRAALAEPETPPEAQTEAEKIAYCAGWWAALAKAREATLAEPLEPVAWMVYTLDGESVCVTDNPADFTQEHRALPLYAAPHQRKPLTDEEVNDLMDQIPREDVDSWAFRQGVCAAEAAHGIKEKT